MEQWSESKHLEDDEESFYKKSRCKYIKDQVGTIYKIHSHQTQSTVTTRQFDTFGNILSQSGPTKGNLGFHSKYFDQESGLNYFFHRYYMPNVGRFITEDPLGIQSDTNLYRYVLNNPQNFSDPFGLEADQTRDDVIERICCIMNSSGMLSGPGNFHQRQHPLPNHQLPVRRKRQSHKNHHPRRQTDPDDLRRKQLP